MRKTHLPVLSSDSGLVRYLEEIKKFPILSEQEESSLATAWHENGDVYAAQKLVTSHLRLVTKLAHQYRGYGLPMTDIISEGNVGLMIAIKKFDPYKGYRLSTYAMWWIKATIQDFILKSWSMVKMGTSAAHKRLFFNLRKVKAKILSANNGVVPANEIDLIAKELDVSKEDASDMNARFTQYETSLNDPSYNDESGEIIDTIADNSEAHDITILEAQDYAIKKEKFNKAFATLSEREQDIISARKMLEKPQTLEVLGEKYGVSTERVRQIEELAIKKLQKLVA
jgi:RNA polymerase sigma-32 factor